MTINLSVPKTQTDLKPRITVLGIGGAGGNAINNMIRSKLEGVEFIVANTDAQALSQSAAERHIQLGTNITQGLGTGARPEIGRAATEEGIDEILDHVRGSHMMFITAGMGGGTGTGGAPVVARHAREQGILTVGVVTKPFHFEGQRRMRVAEAGIEELHQFVDTLIIIPNQNLFRVANEKTTFTDAFKMADEVLYSGVRGVTDLMVMPGLINLDFADIRSVMSEMGKAMMGTGEAEGERRALDAAEAAISNPLLDDTSMKGARGVLINITGGTDMTLFEVDEAANRIREEVDPEANIIFGSTFDESLEGSMRASVVATGIDSEAGTAPRPIPITLVGGLDRTAAPAEVLRIMPTVAAKDDREAAAVDEDTDGAADRAEAGAKPAENDKPAVPPAETLEADAAAPFLAPPPVEPSSPLDREAQPDPFAAAALANGGGKPAKPRRLMPSLLERVTGSARSRQTVQDEKAQDEPASSESKSPQQRLGGLDPAERLAPSAAESDLLDIPAFLRRQAN